MLCPRMGMPLRHSPTGQSATGTGRSCAEARGQGCRGRAWRGTALAGSPLLASDILGLSSVSTSGPKAGAQCVSSARWDLCGGRPEPHWRISLTGEGPFLPRTVDVYSNLNRRMSTVCLSTKTSARFLLVTALNNPLAFMAPRTSIFGIMLSTFFLPVSQQNVIATSLF